MSNSWRFLLGLVFTFIIIANNNLIAAENHWVQPNGGLWNEATNWSLGTVPVSEDDVVIDEPGVYSVEIDSAVTVKSVRIGGASGGMKTLALPGSTQLTAESLVIETNSGFEFNGGLLAIPNLAVRGNFNWSGGFMDASPLLCTIEPTGTLTISALNVFLPGTFQNNGTIMWLGTSLSGSETTILNNAGSFILLTGGSLSGSGVFNNSGTIASPPESSPVLSSPNGWTFVNTGTLFADTNAVFTLENGTFELNGGSTFDGPGLVRFSLGTLPGNGILNVNGTVELAGGMMTGNHIWMGSGQLNWSSGGFDGAGSTLFVPDFDVNVVGFSDKFLSYHSITNLGVLTWNSAGELSGFAEGKFYNKGDLVLGNSCSMSGSGTFENTGIISTAENAFSALSSDTWTFRSKWKVFGRNEFFPGS